MLQRFWSLTGALALALFVTACATPGTGTGEVEIRQGKIEQITAIELQNNRRPGVGAVVGGLVAAWWFGIRDRDRIRRRDLLISEEDLCAFYAERLGDRICDVRTLRAFLKGRKSDQFLRMRCPAQETEVG